MGKKEENVSKIILRRKAHIYNYSGGIQLWDIYTLCEIHVLLNKTWSTKVPLKKLRSGRHETIRDSIPWSYQRMPGNVLNAGKNAVILEYSLGFLLFLFWYPNWIDQWELESTKFIKLPQNIKY